MSIECHRSKEDYFIQGKNNVRTQRLWVIQKNSQTRAMRIFATFSGSYPCEDSTEKVYTRQRINVRSYTRRNATCIAWVRSTVTILEDVHDMGRLRSDLSLPNRGKGQSKQFSHWLSRRDRVSLPIAQTTNRCSSYANITFRKNLPSSADPYPLVVIFPRERVVNFEKLI